MSQLKQSLTTVLFAAGGLCLAPLAHAAIFLDDFESYSNGQIVYTDGGQSGHPVYDSGISQSAFGPAGHTKGMLPGNIGAGNARLTSLTQAVSGDYRLQFDSAQIYNGSGSAGTTNNQLLFARWGTNTNIYLNAESKTAAANTVYDLKYYNGAAWVDTGIDLADDQWYRFRVEWNTTNTTQTLFVNNAPVVTGTLIYGTVANPASLGFVQWNANNYAFAVDNVAFDTGTGEIAIPEPATLALLALGGVLGLTRRRRA